MQGRNPRLGSESDPFIVANATKRKPSNKGGMQSSNSAYMLVYTEKTALAEIQEVEKHKKVKRSVVRQRARDKIRRKNRRDRRNRRVEREIARNERYQMMEDEDEEDYAEFFEDEMEPTSDEEEDLASTDEETLAGMLKNADFSSIFVQFFSN